MDKRYKVAAGRAVTAQGVVFGPGKLLPAEALSADSVSVLLKGKFIVEAEAPAQAEKTAKEEAAPEGGDKKRK